MDIKVIFMLVAVVAFAYQTEVNKDDDGLAAIACGCFNVNRSVLHDFVLFPKMVDQWLAGVKIFYEANHRPVGIGKMYKAIIMRNIPVLFRTTEHVNERYIRFEATSILLPYIELEFMQESNGEDAHEEKSQPHHSATSEDRDLNECASLDYLSRLVIKVHFRRYSLLFQYTFGLMFRSILENYLLESLLNLQNMLNVDTVDFL